MTWPTKIATQEQHQRTYENSAQARRVILVDVNGTPVDPESTAENKVSIFGSSSVGVGATVTLATYTVPAGKRFTFRGGIVGGAEAGEFTLEISSVTHALIRNSGSTRTIIATFPVAPEASAGAVINIKGKNISNHTKSFEATISGYTIDV